jgi:hypothetical protein
MDRKGCMADNAVLPSYPGPDQQVLRTRAVLHDLDVLGVNRLSHLLDRLLKQGAEVDGDQSTGSETGDCPLTPKAATKSLLQRFAACFGWHRQ